VIVAAWALFLVPQWLHRRAEAAARLADRVDDVDAGEGQADVGADVDAGAAPPRRRRVGRRQLARSLPVSTSSGRRWRRPVRAAGRAQESPPPTRSAAARRRRILAVLCMATLATVMAVAMGPLLGQPVPAWVVAVPGGLMTAYLVLLAVLRPGAVRPARPGQQPAVADESTHEVEQPLVVSVEQRPSSVPAAPASGPADEVTWTPVPVPVPTYVTAPKARRAVRTIDLSNPGSWTTTLDTLDDSVDESGPADVEPELHPLLEHRRAVGD
jgi:hypothetical protein